MKLENPEKRIEIIREKKNSQNRYVRNSSGWLVVYDIIYMLITQSPTTMRSIFQKHVYRYCTTIIPPEIL